MPSDSEPDELPYSERVSLAVKCHQRHPDGHPEHRTIRKSAAQYGVSWTTVRDRAKGAIPRQIKDANNQILSSLEEGVIARMCHTLYGWGWPCRTFQLRFMAISVLRARGVTTPLGKNWNSAFLRRNPDLKYKICGPRDRSRTLAQNHEIFEHWFDMYERVKLELGVFDDDVYNMDEKGVMMGISGKLNIIIPKTAKNPNHSGGSGNREWVTSTECVSLTGRKLPSWTIFKGKTNQDKWHATMKRIGQENSGYHICFSENGWTNNELGVEYLEKHFDPHTKLQIKGKSRILILDGHDSHISMKAIQFAVINNIILLCLPPHSTHMLQPLDVGVFGPVGQAYKTGVASKYQWGTAYIIDKCHFLEIWHEAREKAITESNIRSAWRKSGIQQVVKNDDEVELTTRRPRDEVICQLPLKEIVKDSITASRPSTAYSSNSMGAFSTPSNTAQVQAVIDRVKRGDIDENTLLALEKLGKAAATRMTELVLAKSLNTELLDATKERETKKTHNRLDGHDGSKARVMGLEEVERRKAYKLEKQKETDEKAEKARRKLEDKGVKTWMAEVQKEGIFEVFTWKIGIKENSKSPGKGESPRKRPNLSQQKISMDISSQHPSALSNISVFEKLQSNDILQQVDASLRRQARDTAEHTSVDSFPPPLSLPKPVKKAVKTTSKGRKLGQTLDEGMVRVDLEPVEPRISRSGRVIKAPRRS